MDMGISKSILQASLTFISASEKLSLSFPQSFFTTMWCLTKNTHCCPELCHYHYTTFPLFSALELSPITLVYKWKIMLIINLYM